MCIECHISTSSIDAGFTADDVKNDVSLYKVDVNAKSRTAVAGSVGFFKLEEKLFKGKSYFIASSTLKIKCCKSEGKQEKLSIMGVWCG